MRTQPFVRLSIFLILTTFLGCASITQHLQSTKTKTFDKPPYYVSFFKDHQIQITDFAILPVQIEDSRELFTPSLTPLKKAADNFLLKKYGSNFLANFQLYKKEMPEVRFGDERVLYEEDENENASFEMLLVAKHPSKIWQQKWQQAKIGKPYSLLIFLSFSGYQPKMKNWKGSKEVRLGTGYKLDLPWLTDLDKPLPVIQFTGALLDANGKLVRVGAEGFYCKKGSLFESLIGLNDIFTKEDIQEIIAEHRRTDLDGKPLAWQAALEKLIKSLTNG